MSSEDSQEAFWVMLSDMWRFSGVEKDIINTTQRHQPEGFFVVLMLLLSFSFLFLFFIWRQLFAYSLPMMI